VDYARKLTWNKVGKQFFEKAKVCANKAANERCKIREEVIEDLRMVEKQVFDKQLGKIVTTRTMPEKLVWNDDIENEFFERMATKLVVREKKNKELGQKLESESYTFKPYIASARNRDNLDSEDDDDEAGGSNRAIYQRFIHRVDEDIAERRIKNPERFGTKRVYEISKFKA
jgi:hypothetical protein